MSNDAPTVADRKLAVAEAVASLLHDIDARNWSGVRNALGPQVAVDYTSLWGGEPAVTRADDLIDSWQQVLTGFQATQHLLGPIVVQIDDDAATVNTHVRAQHVHRDGRGLWTVGGHYTLRLEYTADGWFVTGMRLDLHYQEGALEPSVPHETSTTT